MTHARPASDRPPVRPLPIPLAIEAPADLSPVGYLVSEKLDGVRAVWDGKRMRFRSGLDIKLPDSFARRLPPYALDGELWIGRGQFETLSGMVRRQVPSEEEWRAVRYAVFDLPGGEGGFAARAEQLSHRLRGHASPQLFVVQQRHLVDRQQLLALMDEVVNGGGEGLILRAQDDAYRAGRGPGMLKLKPLADAEATVVAHEPGKGRFSGQLGALRVRTEAGLEFKLGTGFTDEQRQRPPAIGQRVTFTYRGLTEEGVPRFASFLRVRPDGV